MKNIKQFLIKNVTWKNLKYPLVFCVLVLLVFISWKTQNHLKQEAYFQKREALCFKMSDAYQKKDKDWSMGIRFYHRGEDSCFYEARYISNGGFALKLVELFTNKIIAIDGSNMPEDIKTANYQDIVDKYFSTKDDETASNLYKNTGKEILSIDFH